jgi:PAS domain S-box-containing protein
MRLRVLFGMMIALLVAAAGITYAFGGPVLAASQQIIEQQRLMADLEQTLSRLKDADNWEDAYVVTGDDKFLVPYHESLTDMRSHLAQLGEQADAGLRDPQNVGRVSDLVDEKVAEMNRTIALRRESGLEPALAALRTDAATYRMAGIDQLVAEMIDRRRSKVISLEARTHQLTKWRNAVFVTSATAEILFCLWAYGRIVAGLRQEAAAAAEIRRQKDLLSVTLSSIGDAVMVTDMGCRITFMNSVAESLTGWPLAEAKGRPIQEVFRIINEETRQPVENPVEKVMKLGMIVGLANHTLLVRRDGSEVPIDDSGAPIRDEGRIHGAVLVFRDFTEHKQAEHALRQARADAEAANRAKDQFLAMLSHELRTPLTPVSATLDMWASSSDLPETIKADVQMLRRNVELEVRLIDDLLDLTRIAKSKLTLRIQTVNMHDVVRSVAGIVQQDVEGKELQLAITCAARRPLVRGDSARLQQVLWNLVKNAVKFTTEGGRIDLETADGPDGGIDVRVTDTGIGISADMMERVFKPFEQGSGDTARRYGGLGLGLAISKALVEEQGGRISVHSEGPGRGSTFMVSLPTVDAASPHAELRREPTPAVGMETAPAHGQGGTWRILLVEDHQDTARAMNRVLLRLGYDVTVAHSVSEAQALAGEQEFDLLLSDLGLPDGTGLDLVRAVLARRHIPAVALTGYGMEEDVARCREAGFKAHLTKPVNFQKLQATLREVIAEAKGAAAAEDRQAVTGGKP